MKLFTCSNCRQPLFFENVQCVRCTRQLAYLPDLAILSALEPANDGSFTPLAPEANGARYRLCDNYTQYGVCNWAVTANSAETLCQACRLNHLIPNLSEPGAREVWQKLETAKRRLLFTILEFGLPLEAGDSSGFGLGFSFQKEYGDQKVFTGHSDGLITINIAESDNPFREKIREQMGETYRTLLGHFRHEVGHYYWDRLVRGTAWLEPFRQEFGDERADYAESQKRHYGSGPAPNWPLEFVSAYASMHPWEDWAETFAHYLHMVDTLETAQSFGLVLNPKPAGGAQLERLIARRSRFDHFEELIAAWYPLTIAMNSFNRSMGLADLYPFVLSERAVQKIRFVHEVLMENGRRKI
jgi:hypothetical protein